MMNHEHSVAKIMRTGSAIGLILMAIGFIMSFFTSENLSAKPIYAAVFILVLTPCTALVYFMVYFFYNNEKKYSVICLLIVLFLAGVTVFKVIK